jgi:cell division protein FtsB
MANQNNTVSPCQILLPVLLVALVLFVSLGFQGVQIMRDRDSLHQFISQQDKPLEDSRKVQAQMTALALGAKKLADGGDKNAAAIIARLQQLGITVGGNAPAAGPAGTPPALPADAPAPLAP